MIKRERWVSLLLPAVVAVLVMSCAPLANRRSQPQAGGQPAQPTHSGTWTLQHGTYTRSYIVYAPPNLPAGQAVPLVLVFHGGGGQAKGTAGFTGFNRLADAHGFIAVYPDGLDRRWRGQPGAPDDKTVDDVGFISALIDQVSKGFVIDPKRVYATGISNGAGFSYRLACELSDRIAAIGPVAGAINADEARQCQPTQPVAVIDFHGTADPIIHYNGGAVMARVKGEILLSTPDTIAFWRQVNGCPATEEAQTLPQRDPAGGTRVERRRWQPCRGGTAVEAYTITGGGHTWPGGSQYLPEQLIGKTTRDIVASELIWNFFTQHPRS